MRSPWPVMKHDLSVAQQYHQVKSSELCPGSGTFSMGKFSWNFTVKPTPLSGEYKLQLNFSRSKGPEVFVLSPDLRELAGGRQLPHVYSQERRRLCLYLPGTGEWTRSMPLTETVVPWSYLWLYYFEDWLATDQWRGGGKHPSGRKRA